MTVPKNFCLLMKTKKTSPEVLKVMKEALDVQLEASCVEFEGLDENPFRQTEWRTPPHALSFELDGELGGSYLSLRGLDPTTGLQWGQAKASSSGLRLETSLRQLASSLVVDLLRQFPFVGVVDSMGFYLWAKPAGSTVSVADRKQSADERHPFLPKLLKIGFAVEKTARLTEDSRGLRTLLLDGDLSERRWLVSVAGTRPRK